MVEYHLLASLFEGSELRAAVYPQGVAGDPTSVGWREKGYRWSDIAGLCRALQRQQTDGELAPGVGLVKVRHVRLGYALSHGIDMNALWPGHEAKCLTMVSIAPFKVVLPLLSDLTCLD
jgi:hypothetical protein